MMIRFLDVFHFILFISSHFFKILFRVLNALIGKRFKKKQKKIFYKRAQVVQGKEKCMHGKRFVRALVILS